MVKTYRYPDAARGFAVAKLETHSMDATAKLVAKAYHVTRPSRSTLHRWRNEHGADAKKASGGRKRAVTPQINARLLRASRLHRGGFYFEDFRWLVKEVLGLGLSASTLRRWLASCKLLEKSKRRWRWQLTPAQKDNRLKWCKANQGRVWEQALFADEKTWGALANTPTMVYWGVTKDMPQLTVNLKRFQLNCWGVIGVPFKHLEFIKGTLKGPQYLKMLDSSLPKAPSDQDVVFLHDNAPVHLNSRDLEGSADVLAGLGYRALPIPPYSPDLNPIENVWGIMSRSLKKKNTYIKGEKPMMAAIQQEFAKLCTPAFMLKLSRSMEKRMQQVIARRGDFADY